MAESREPAGPDGAAALRAEVAFLRQLADNVPVAIAYYEASTLACRYANASYCRMFGHDATSILGRSFAEVIGPVAANAIQPAVDRLIQQGESAVYEREVPSLGGPARWIEVHLLPHRGDGEAVVGCFVLISDITRHRLAEAALRQGEERLAKFMQASAEGIVFHRHGFVTDVNPPFLALAGYSLDELMGGRRWTSSPPTERDRVAAVMADPAPRSPTTVPCCIATALPSRWSSSCAPCGRATTCSA
jgi:PAS domain S-box-containing protein